MTSFRKTGRSPSTDFDPDPSQLVFLGDVYLEEPARIGISGTVVFNHEYVVSTPEDTPAPGKVNLLARDQFLYRTFHRADHLHAGMTNNHTMDFGRQPFDRTVDSLIAHGTHPFGTAFRQNDSLHTHAGVTWCVLGYSMAKPSDTMSPESLLPRLTADIATARQNGAERIFVSIHFGNEHDPRATFAQRVVARAAIDSGADLVVGHHTHCIQDAEVYRGRHIYYGLGNTWFPPHSTPAYYDAAGTSHRVFRARATRWNMMSLMVLFDVQSGSVEAWRCSSRNGVFRVIEKTDVGAINRSVSHRWPRLVGHMRRHWLFLKSNTFVDGKLIDGDAFLHKFREKARYHGVLPDSLGPRGTTQ